MRRPEEISPEVNELLNRRAPRRGIVINTDLGFGVQEAREVSPGLVAFQRGLVAEYLSPDNRQTVYRRVSDEPLSVRTVGQLTTEPDITSVLVWNDRRRVSELWLGFYDRWMWQRQKEDAELALGNVVSELPWYRQLQDAWTTLRLMIMHRGPVIWASPMRPRVDQHPVQPLMGIDLDQGIPVKPELALLESGSIEVRGLKAMTGRRFRRTFREIQGKLEEAVATGKK